ncbi:hypothetical protein Tco_0051925 [Tanacetum coccineum]
MTNSLFGESHIGARSEDNSMHLRPQGNQLVTDDDILYKFKEGDFHRLRIQDIEDMLLLLVQGKLINLNVEERLAFNVSLRMFTRSVVIQRRVEDLQLGVESYQKKLNLTKPDTYRSNLRRRDAYTPYVVVRYRYSNPMIQPEPEGSTQGYPLVSVEVLRFNTTAGNPVKNILLKLNLSDHMSILTNLKVTPTKPGRMTKPYSSLRFIANCFITGNLKMVMKITMSNTSSRNKLNPEVNDHYNIFTRGSQEYELKTKDEA